MKPKLSTLKSAVKKKVTKPATAKKNSAATAKRTAVKVSKPKRKAVATRKVPVASTAARSRTIAKPKPEMIKQQDPHLGMMGDGTEEQNLNQQGNPGARIGQDEVDDAFKKSD